MLDHSQADWRKPIRRSAIAMYVVTLLVIGMAGSASAQTIANSPMTSAARHNDAKLRFALPAEPLAETLRAISQQSGSPVRFQPNDIEGIRAPAIQGRYTAVAALQKAIAGTKATMSSAPGGGWVVFVPSTMGTVTVTANEAESQFQATRSDTSSRSGIDLMDLPSSETIITSAVMQSQQATEIEDVLQDVSGVQTTAASQGPASFNIRGLPATSLSDGLANTFGTNTNIAGVQRIEVLKGPQAILSGGDSLGGAVNVVLKKPSAKPIANVTLQDGTYGDKTASFDFSDGLAANGRLSGRLIGSWTRASTSDAGYDGRRENYLMPEIRWKDDRTDFNVGVSYDDERDPLGRYTFAPVNKIVPVPTMLLGNKDNDNEVKQKSLFYSLEHKFTPWLSVVSRFNRSIVNEDLNVWLGLGLLDLPSMTYMYGSNTNFSRYDTTSTDNYLRFTFRTGPFKHVLSTGINTTSLLYTQAQYQLPNLYPVQVLSPDQYDFPYSGSDPADLDSINRIASKQIGAYAQDFVTFGNFHALLNIRRNKYQSGPDIIYMVPKNFTSGKQQIYKATPGAGLVYDLTPNVSIYGSFSEGFTPNFTSSQICGSGSGLSAPPQTSRNQELGVKVSSPDGMFSFTSGVFNLTQHNVLQYNRALNCNALVRGVQTRGIEMDAQGQIVKGWNLIASLTHGVYRNIGQSGFVVAGEPMNHLNVWTVYDFQGGWLHGFGVGGGIVAYSRSYTSPYPGAPSEPGGARVDLSAYYNLEKHWLFTLGIKNIFDRTLYGVTSTNDYIPVEPGRTLMVTAKYNFL